MSLVGPSITAQTSIVATGVSFYTKEWRSRNIPGGTGKPPPHSRATVNLYQMHSCSQKEMMNSQTLAQHPRKAVAWNYHVPKVSNYNIKQPNYDWTFGHQHSHLISFWYIATFNHIFKLWPINPKQFFPLFLRLSTLHVLPFTWSDYGTLIMPVTWNI